MNKILYTFSLVFLFVSCKETSTVETVNENESSNVITISKEQFEASKMQIGFLNEQDFDVVLNVTGKIDVPSKDKANITVVLGGYIKKSFVMIGDNIKKGQAIAIIENTDFVDIQRDYLEVSEQLKYLKSEYLRQKALFDENITSQKNYFKAESEYKKNLGSYNSLRTKLQLININPDAVRGGNLTSSITIYSPIDGVVVKTNASLGAYIAPENTIVEIVDNRNLHLSLAVFEKDILNVFKGQEIQFSIGDNTTKSYSSKIEIVGKAINEEDRSISVFGKLTDDLKEKLIVGMFVNASILQSNKKAMALPKSAVISENDKKFVLLLQKKSNTVYTFKKVAVKTGVESDNFIEIIPNSLVNNTAELLTNGTL